MNAIVGAIGWSWITGRTHDGNNSTGGTPALENTKAMHGTPSQKSTVLLFERTAIAITAVEKMTTTNTGTNTNGITASQPPSKRSPSPTPTAVISAAPTSVRAASASNLPVRALARFTGNAHNWLSRPLSRSARMVRPAASDPNIAPATAHIGTKPYRLSVPVTLTIDLPTRSL